MSTGLNDTNFHYEWLKRTIEWLDKRKQTPDGRYTQMDTGELQGVFGELLSVHLRCDRLEDMLSRVYRELCH